MLAIIAAMKQIADIISIDKIACSRMMSCASRRAARRTMLLPLEPPWLTIIAFFCMPVAIVFRFHIIFILLLSLLHLFQEICISL